ncbi:amidase/aspartyl-tRNA(Asn)/glutamyl-tRNA(Gln) amidotransferase subunit A [Tistlia consotensis]|uniref:Amidase/aspartyl-tRNA(Asn)/glutamyl-tRNA(Gln) amidotransferase subunit A n=1 Tax=Tistlia consotensis USBA 355 TaxID=560819 RepID=A0A1Y6C8C1_9PROT|nr:amidase family protein [Tistlia consotensis]SMF48914.1 amidase/aspartyl-tRNA(Asn)/glutamyl-tRNA(Gln) amidotransferase subunit A [Tistlia consotensis USBA 355]SNR80650.1 amidase/aspartyl-tRNA(Asn)/glutamyl-tRNA(Gln) amidotransferase subunit A [Tistlia consotensis]
MSDLELAYASASELAARIRGRSVSAEEVVRNALARIEQVNGALNCFCFVYPDEALALAREADRRLAHGEAVGPLHGVPVAIKDFTPTKGKRTTRGSMALKDWVPDDDPVIVERLRGAGAIVVGKTTTPEFAYAGVTHSRLWGITRNPWDLARTPGGSSGGSGAAVAAGCVPLAEGTDMGGSVRIPASCCGIVGLKPSLGRIPMDILPSVFDDISHFGPLARTVDDAALFLEVTHGPDERDINSLPSRIADFGPVRRGVEGLRLAFSPDLGFYGIDPEVEAVTRRAVGLLRERGALVEEIELGWTRVLHDAWNDLWDVYLAAFAGQHLAGHRDEMDPELVRCMDAGFARDAVSIKRIEILRSEQWQSLRRLFERCDALLCPTSALPPPPVEAKESDVEGLDEAGRLRAVNLTTVFNLVAPCPVAAVPSGLTPAGLPASLQIVGRRHDDVGVLRIARALEEAVGWPDWRPTAVT